MTDKRGSIRLRGRDAWELRVYRGVDPDTGSQRYATRTVHGSRRTAQRALQALVAKRRDKASSRARDAAAMLSGGAFAFTGKPDGHKPYSPSWATASFTAARRACGLPHFRLHDLRHLMATQMLAAGVPLVTVSARLNHARISTTVNVYTHAIRGWD